MVINVQNIFLEHDFYLKYIYFILGIKEKSLIYDPCNVLLAISTNILVRLKTGFVVAPHDI